MNNPFSLRSTLLIPIVALSIGAFAVTGCGGDSGSDTSSSDSSPATTEEATTTEGATLDQVLACLQDEGIDAKDQSSNISGETIGIDYSGGRTTISFDESEDDADITAMLAEDYGEVLQAGSVVATIDPTADTADSAVIESCIAG